MYQRLGNIYARVLEREWLKCVTHIQHEPEDKITQDVNPSQLKLPITPAVPCYGSLSDLFGLRINISRWRDH